MKYISFGIDLGTTNSAIAYCSGGKSMDCTIIDIPNSKEGGIVPSCVKYITKDDCVVGLSSYKERWKPSVVYSMKRHMVLGDSYKHKVIAENGEEFYVSPIDVGAKVLGHLKTYAEESLGVDGKEVKAKYTITVPAYFNEVARYNTVQAGIRAGIPEEDITLINEPTAAALSYGSRGKKSRERILVYDLGGGTFDIAVLDIIRGKDGKPTFTVKSCAGDDNLGGDDLDLVLADLIINKLVEKLNELLKEKDIPFKATRELFNTEFMYKYIIFNAECCKKAGKTATVSIQLNELDIQKSILDELGEDFVLSVNITDKEMRDASDNLLISKTTAIVDELIYQQSVSTNKMILIGGSTKGEDLINSLDEYYPNLIVNNTSDPDRSVALGASIYSEMQNIGESDRLQDVIQLPIGVLSVDDGVTKVSKIIRQNTKIPTAVCKSYQLLSTDQDSISVEVYQGRSSIPEDCTYLGKLEVDGLSKFQKEKIERLRKAGDTLTDPRLTVDIYLSVTVSGTLKATVTVDGKSFEGVINRLSAGTKNEDSKMDMIKRRQINSLKRIVFSEDLDKVLAEYEKEFSKGLKNASAFVQKCKESYEINSTSLFE